MLVATFGFVGDAAQQVKPRFEVASVRPHPERLSLSNAATAGIRLRPGGVFTASRATVLSLIWFAYDLKPFQVSGAPDWTERDFFDISARAGDVPEEQVKLMVRSLLEDRFRLLTHLEKRDMPFVALVLARRDGRLGPYIRLLGDDCTAATAAEAKKQFPPRPDMTSGGTLRGACSPLSHIADSLTYLLREPVLDETGVTGKFVWEMRSASLTPNPASNDDPRLSPLKESLADQLGLKLEARRGPIEVLVVKSVQQPDEN